MASSKAETVEQYLGELGDDRRLAITEVRATILANLPDGVVETMASHRPYRPSMGIDKALEEVTQNRGVLYESLVVDACLKIFNTEGFQLPS